jgi:hypothetical protein
MVWSTDLEEGRGFCAENPNLQRGQSGFPGWFGQLTWKKVAVSARETPTFREVSPGFRDGLVNRPG